MPGVGDRPVRGSDVLSSAGPLPNLSSQAISSRGRSSPSTVVARKRSTTVERFVTAAQ
jgi:hypothetical protein